MTRVAPAFLMVVIAVSALFSGPDRKMEAEFFAGVTLLSQKTDLKPDEREQKFRELEVMTGISAADAAKLLSYYRERPTEWQKIYNEMVKLLNETNLGLEKKEGAKDTLKKAPQINVFKPRSAIKTKK
jgi:hypothetical protein